MRLAGLALVSAAALSIACATVRVTTDYDQQYDFTRLSTYAWLEEPMREEARGDEPPSANPFTYNTLIDKRVRDEVEAWLAARGYRAAAAGEAPDFLLRYELVSRPVEREYPVFVSGGYGYGYRGYGYGTGVGYGRSVTYDEGTLIIDVIDPASQRIAWRGFGTSETRDLQMKPERLQKTVTAILERFPPKPEGGAAAREPAP